MELRQITAFLAVAEELHFGRAAARLHIAQPPLSQRIRALERELGAPLFERTTRSVRLTASGAALLEPARLIAQNVEVARRAARAAHLGEIGTVRVGFAGNSGYAALAELVRAVGEEHPAITVELHPQTYSADAALDVRDGRLDLAIVSLPTLDGLKTHAVRREVFLLAVPEDHRLAGRKRVRIADVRSETFVAPPATRGSRVREVLYALAADAGFEPYVAHEAPDPYSLLSLVGAGVGVALVVESARHIQVEGVRYIPVTAPGASLSIALAWRGEQRSAVVGAVVAVARRTFTAR
ncbi:LysR family transcriptional regulator [Epidermidibacterium keratini]|uniref:LysR family transcriptional regulator n=1 Tax=Epidermidibacterium keratini TaxID=1891644 RepID=A0A7L4YRN4_9ACTN|nr:LysR substrate-binding domain-containing protein [Epidermidibacterium keratini]QHC01227.1 LysR family transcriptional regulator [Epidermidibacterium keratini]